MKTIVLILSLVVLAPNQNALNSSDLHGEWKIDLRPTPDSSDYFQMMTVSNIKDNTFEGTFYGSGIKDGLLNTSWDKVYFSFTTSDATNNYYHSGYIENGKLYGISYCPKREFTAPWTGEKKK
ncbi:hypothetical protein [Winogradskyella sp. A2]|uniref:hypothetical protein n=1 Tax=Winogradskyella sp. A2 TaxID=3366944 RepID=UPI00398C680C